MVRRLTVLLISIVLPLTATYSGCKTQHDSSQSSAKRDSISLPQAHHAEPDLDINKGSSALITISSDGEYYFGPDKISQSDIGQKVNEKLKDQPSDYHIVYVKSGKDVQYEKVLAVLDSIRKVGYDRIGLVVEEEGKKEPMIIEARLSKKRDEKEIWFPPEDILIVDIKPMGVGLDQSVDLNTRAMSLIELGSLLENLLEQRPIDERTVHIIGPKDKSYGDVIAVIDVVKGAGAKHVDLMVDPEDFSVMLSAPPPPPPAEGKSEPPDIIRKSGGVLLGEALHRVQPTYPPLAKAARVSGAVVVEITIDEDGNVISGRAVSGHPLLTDAAVTAARRWKFKPTLQNGVPMTFIGTITFNFTE